MGGKFFGLSGPKTNSSSSRSINSTERQVRLSTAVNPIHDKKRLQKGAEQGDLEDVAL